MMRKIGSRAVRFQWWWCKSLFLCIFYDMNRLMSNSRLIFVALPKFTMLLYKNYDNHYFSRIFRGSQIGADNLGHWRSHTRTSRIFCEKLGSEKRIAKSKAFCHYVHGISSALEFSIKATINLQRSNNQHRHQENKWKAVQRSPIKSQHFRKDKHEHHRDKYPWLVYICSDALF